MKSDQRREPPTKRMSWKPTTSVKLEKKIFDNMMSPDEQETIAIDTRHERCAIKNNSMREKSSNCYAGKKSLYATTNEPQIIMYNHISSLQNQSNKRQTSVRLPLARPLSYRRDSPSAILSEKLTRPLLALVVALALTSSIVINQTQALSSSSTNGEGSSTSAQHPSVNQPHDGNKQVGPNDRSDSSQANSSSGSSSLSSLSSTSSSSSSPNSIVASLSSAVATAAAAAAVAAAQNSLSGNDARSLLIHSSSNHGSSSHHQSRSPGLNLAIKIADTIPEVPYNILHNMKKLDHAAPFYNVPNKITGSGKSKESSPTFLANALTATGGLGGAADQLTALFKSPLWKRIADGYGEFTSEFRSLFRGPATPMKGSTSSTTKLIRDISVPALLMLLASSIPSDWRPMRTRRKSFMPADMSQPLDLMTASASDTPNFSIAPPAPFKQSNFRDTIQQQVIANPRVMEQNIGQSFMQQLEQQQMAASVNPMTRVSDINFQGAPDAGGNWMSSRPVSVVAPGQNHFDQAQQIQQQQQPLQPIKRVGETTFQVAPVDFSRYQQEGDAKLVKENRSTPSSAGTSRTLSAIQSQQPTGSLFSSLTSSLAHFGQSKLMNRILNIDNGNMNGLKGTNLHSIIGNQPDDVQRIAVKSDHLNDRHRYSLVGLDDDSNLDQERQEKLSPSLKPSLLSAISRTISSVFEPKTKLSLVPSSRQAYSPAHETASLIGDKTINYDEGHNSIGRRQSGPIEQRELTQFLPPSWREVVKRTMNNVQQQATVQWKSIEGQLTNWVQDKLKTLPGTSVAANSPPSPVANLPAPVANIISTVGTTALNILGLNGKNTQVVSSAAVPIASESSGSQITDSVSVQKSKIDSPNKSTQTPSKGALAGVADLLVNKLANRASSTSPSPKQATVEESSSSSNHYPTHSNSQSAPSQATSP